LFWTNPNAVKYDLAWHTDQLASFVEEAGKDRVAAVVTDNAANMKKARALLKRRYPAIIIFR
jgi:hypothetical protein